MRLVSRLAGLSLRHLEHDRKTRLWGYLSELEGIYNFATLLVVILTKEMRQGVKFLVLFAIQLLSQLLSLDAKPLTLRLRLPSGQVSRIEADDNEDVENFRVRLQREGKIPIGSSMAVKGITYEDGGDEKGGSSLSTLGIANGEIISVKVGIEEEMSNGDKTGGSGKDSPSRRTKESSTRKSMMSNADIEERRKSLTKIARQKSTGKRYVSVTSTAGNVLKRLAFSKHGGVALLIGRTVREKDSQTAKTSTARERALAKVNKKLPSSSASSDDPARECIEVHAMFELLQEDSGGKDRRRDLSSDATILAVSNIAKKMGLSVVGVGVSVGTSSGGSAKKQAKAKACLWSSDHVHRALQVRGAVLTRAGARRVGKEGKDSNTGPLFCVLGVAQRTGEGDEDAAGGKAKVKVDRATRDANPELMMEAFELSKQALELHSKGILTKMPMTPAAITADDGAIDEEGGGGKKERARGRPIVNKMNMAGPSSAPGTSQGAEEKKKSKDAGELIHLTSAVLTQSDESTAIDPLLLAVPLPIVAIDASAPTIKKKEDKSAVRNRAARPAQEQAQEQWRPESLGITFEHSYPSPVETSSSAARAEEAEAHLCDVCEQLTHTSQPRHMQMFSRLRDMHILFRLSQLMEAGAVKVLCGAVGKADCITAPAELGSSFELLRLSLSAASSSSSSQSNGKNAKGRKRPQRRITREMRARGDTGDDELEEI